MTAPVVGEKQSVDTSSDRAAARPSVPAAERPHGQTPISMIERMTLILRAFDQHSRTLSLLDLAERSGLPRSTVHRIVDQMIRYRWLAHCAGGYRLGMRPLELGGLAAEHDEVRGVVSPVLHELCHRTGLAGHLAVLDGRDVVYLDKAGGRFAATLPTRVGARMPAHCTALGKAILASLEPHNVDATFRARLATHTSHTIGDIEELHEELARVRTRHGVARDYEETVAGIGCVAAPINGTGHTTAALSLCGEARSMPMQRISHMVLQATRHATRALGGH